MKPLCESCAYETGHEEICRQATRRRWSGVVGSCTRFSPARRAAVPQPDAPQVRLSDTLTELHADPDVVRAAERVEERLRAPAPSDDRTMSAGCVACGALVANVSCASVLALGGEYLCPECDRKAAHQKAGDAPAPSSGEVRVVDPLTGGEKGSKLARYDLIPAGPLWELAEHFGRGARKYEDRNWEKGYRWGLSFAALMRHAWAFWRGEDKDEETGSSHLIAVAWHALALREFQLREKGTDDRATEKTNE